MLKKIPCQFQLGRGRYANRGTQIFRQVMHVALSRLASFERVGFNGAHPKLDRIYSRLEKLPYFHELLKLYGLSMIRQGRDVFLDRVGPAQLEFLVQIPLTELQPGQWYVGRGRNSNVGLWDGKHFLVISEKAFEWVVKREGYYTLDDGCFQPFRRIDEGRVVVSTGEPWGYARIMGFVRQGGDGAKSA